MGLMGPMALLGPMALCTLVYWSTWAYGPLYTGLLVYMGPVASSWPC